MCLLNTMRSQPKSNVVFFKITLHNFLDLRVFFNVPFSYCSFLLGIIHCFTCLIYLTVYASSNSPVWVLRNVSCLKIEIFFFFLDVNMNNFMAFLFYNFLLLFKLNPVTPLPLRWILWWNSHGLEEEGDFER